MRALAIAPEPFFTPRGTPFSVYYRTLVMSELGVDVDLLTYGEGVDVEIPGVRIFRIPHPTLLGSVRVGPSFLKAFLDLLLLFRLVGRLARDRYDVVHAHEEASFFCALLKPLFGYRFIYDMHSSLPEQLTNFGFTRSRLLIGLFERLEALTLRRADAVITVSPALAEHARRRMPEPRRQRMIENSLLDEVRLGPNGAGDPEDEEAPGSGSAESGIRTLDEPRAAERRLVVYAGNFERYQGLHLLVPAFARVAARVPDAFLVMVGGTPRQVARYRRMAADHGVARHCHIGGRVPHAVARKLVSRADVLVSPRTEGTNTPLKIYEQLASGRPLVATRILAHTQVLTEDACVLVEPDPDALAEGIATALQDEGRRRRVTRRARRLYRERYGRDAYARKLRGVLEIASDDASPAEPRGARPRRSTAAARHRSRAPDPA